MKLPKVKSRMEWMKEILEVCQVKDSSFPMDHTIMEIVEKIQQEVWDEARSKYYNKAYQFNSILRPDKQGQPDDLVIDCDWIHLERMDNHWWWMGIYRGNKRVTLYIGLDRTPNGVGVTVEEDEFGLVDDSKEIK